MKIMKLTIMKEVSSSIDTESNSVLVTLLFGAHTLDGYATHITTSNTYHLDTGFEKVIEEAKLDADEIRDALEDGELWINVEVEDNKRDDLESRFKNLNLGTVSIEQMEKALKILGSI